jgi:hypothetical protein
MEYCTHPATSGARARMKLEQHASERGPKQKMMQKWQLTFRNQIVGRHVAFWLVHFPSGSSPRVRIAVPVFAKQNGEV